MGTGLGKRSGHMTGCSRCTDNDVCTGQKLQAWSLPTTWLQVLTYNLSLFKGIFYRKAHRIIHRTTFNQYVIGFWQQDFVEFKCHWNHCSLRMHVRDGSLPLNTYHPDIHCLILLSHIFSLPTDTNDDLLSPVLVKNKAEHSLFLPWQQVQRW